MGTTLSFDVGHHPDSRRPGSADSPRRRWRARLTWLLLACAALIVAAGAGFLAWADSYQPLVAGAVWGSDGSARVVNHFGPVTGDLYVPPGPGTFTITVSFANTGPAPVTILGVALGSLSGHHTGLPFAVAGPITYWGTNGWSPHDRPLRSLVLPAGESMTVDIPLQLSSPCWTRHSGWVRQDDFYVEERVFSVRTRWAALPLHSPVIVHAPGGPLGPSAVCGAHSSG